MTSFVKAGCLALIMAFLVGCLGERSEPQAMKALRDPSWKAGWARVEITPPYLTPLAGYGNRNGELSQGTHDPLMARALVLEDARGQILALVSCDLIGISDDLKQAVLDRLPGLTGIQDDNLILCATHTHSGAGAVTRNPLAKFAAGDFDPQIFDFLVQRITSALQKAYRARAPAQLWLGQGRVDGLSRNRRRPNGPVEKNLGVLHVRPRRGRGVLVAHFAMHPTLLPSGHMTYSADFPGAFARVVEEAGFDLALFLNGALGDQAPVAPAGASPLESVEAVGQRLAHEAMNVARTAPRRLKPSLHIVQTKVNLPPTVFQPLMPPDTKIQSVILDDLLWLTFPGEPVAEVGSRFRALARQMGFDTAWLVSLANDHLGYFDTLTGFSKNTYESLLTFHGPASYRAILEALPQMNGHREWAKTETQTQETWEQRTLARASKSRRGKGWFLRLSGSPRQMGFQHGSLMKSELQSFYKDFQDWMDGELRNYAQKKSPLVSRLVKHLRPSAAIWPWLCLKSRELLPFIPPELIEEMEGLAQGSGLPFDGVLLINVFLTLAEQEDRENLFFEALQATCTNLVLLPPRTSGDVIHARNLDWGMTDILPRIATTILFEPDQGFSFASVGWAGMVGTLSCMNSQGLSMTEESVAAKQDTRLHGVPLMLLMRQVIQHSRTLEQAVRRLVEAPGTCGYHITVVDAKGPEARVVERSATHAAVRKPQAGLLPGVTLSRRAEWFESNRLPHPLIPRSNGSSERRYGRLEELLHESGEAASLQKVFSMFRDEQADISSRRTLHSVIFDPAKFQAWVAHGSLPAPAGTYERFEFSKELTRHTLSGATRQALEEALGTSPAWDRVDDPVKGRLITLEGPQANKPFRVIELHLPSTLSSPHPSNNTLYARIYEPEGPPLGTVIFLPMWKGRDLDAEDVICREMSRRGFRMALMPQAYQWQRSPRGIRSGALLLSADPIQTRQAIIQTLADAKRLARWLTDQYPQTQGRLGLMGLSLGAFTGSILYSLDSQFSCGVFLLAGGDISRVLLSGGEDVRDISRDFKAQGISPAEIRKRFKMLNPARVASPERGEGVLLINALFDDTVSYANASLLAEAYGYPKHLWLPSGHHGAAFFLNQVLDRTVGHLRKHMAP